METIIKVVIITTVIIILIVLIFSLYVSKVIAKPINQTNHRFRDIAGGDGDLAKQLSIDTKEELGTLAGIVQKNEDIIADSSARLNSAADQANQEIDNIENEINRITDGLQNNAGILEEATVGIEEMASGTVMVSSVLKLKEMVGTMENVQKSSVLIYQMIEELKNTSGRINEIAALLELNNITQTLKEETKRFKTE